MKKYLYLGAAIVMALIIIYSMIMSTVTRSQQSYETYIAELSEAGVSERTEQFRSYVENRMELYGLPEGYANLILQMIEVYSDTYSFDVMNASYTQYNKKFPQRTNGIIDPLYSISCGVQEMKRLVDKIEEKYEVDILEEESQSYLLILVQAYEVGADSYIAYAVENGGYTYEDTMQFVKVTLGLKKQNIDSYFAAKVVGIGTTDETANDIQKQIVMIARNFEVYNVSTVPGYCLQFVNDIYDAAGVGPNRTHCARCAGAYFGVSNDWSTIPVGAAVYGYALNQYGHVGLYIGNGQVIHNGTGNPRSDAEVLKRTNGGYVAIQSLTSFITQFDARCWGFSGSKQFNPIYPPQPFTYMSTH